MRIRTVVLLLVICLALLSAASYLIRFKKGVSVEGAGIRAERVNLAPVAPRHEYGRYGFSDVAITDRGRVFAVGYDGHDPRKVYDSLDGGITWEGKLIETNWFTMHAITFVDNQDGWAVGGYGLVMHTSNGGESWERVEAQTHAALDAVHFANKSVGYIAGSTGVYDKVSGTSTFGVVILRTTDGGKTWQTCYQDEETGTVFQIATPSDSIAIVLLDDTHQIRTEDGGASWQALSIDNAKILSSIFTVDGAGWAVGDSGAVYRSLDKGKSWQKVEGLPKSLLSKSWWSIDFADAQLGVVVGEHGALAVTNDGGRHWFDAATDVKEDLRVVRLRGRTGLVLGSQNVFRLVVGE